MSNEQPQTPDISAPPELSEFDDHRRPLQRAVKLGTVALVVLTIISLAVWGGLRDLPGIWGVLIGAALGGGFVILTALSVLITSNTDAATTGAIVLGSWLLKIVVLIIVLVVIRDMQFYDTVALFVTVILALIVVLAMEVWGVMTSRVTYIG
ncbi:hypothetical protein [uncultured Corynebacterium sp.]|uniref:hypothetical protein n=1 Tax=uncultured Corynebacterium sp. TaxID=159447 RepID=UPI0025E83283|nr:hypothetical protein [uncultured Corynebacterium sp.]